MTPEKVLDLTFKFGVAPVLFYVVMLTRADMEEMKTDLRDCYRERIQELKPNKTAQIIRYDPKFALIPCDPVGKIKRS